jgi:hypothetical protein
MVSEMPEDPLSVLLVMPVPERPIRRAVAWHAALARLGRSGMDAIVCGGRAPASRSDAVSVAS